MKYLLDTCVVSDFVKGDINTLNRIKITPPSEIAVSTITIMEIEYGLALNPKLAKAIKTIILEFIAAVNILNFTQEDANHVAITRALLKQQGNPIGSYDILLGGTALHNNLILVTSNTKEFNRIPSLKLEDWRQTHVKPI